MTETQCMPVIHLRNAQFFPEFSPFSPFRPFRGKRRNPWVRVPDHWFLKPLFNGNWGLVKDDRNLTKKPSMSRGPGRKSENQAKEDSHFIALEDGRLRNKRKKRPNIDIRNVYLQDKGYSDEEIRDLLFRG